MKTLFLSVIVSILFIGCGKEENATQNFEADYCDELNQSLVQNNAENVRTIINLICMDFPAKQTTNDSYGHSENTDRIIEKINSDCPDLKLTKICYACLESFPHQSIIEVKADSAGVQIKRTMYLFVPSYDFMYAR